MQPGMCSTFAVCSPFSAVNFHAAQKQVVNFVNFWGGSRFVWGQLHQLQEQNKHLQNVLKEAATVEAGELGNPEAGVATSELT